MLEQNQTADVGVIVARFQVHDLHEAQIGLIQTVRTNHDKFIIFLGISPQRGTRNNALDFQARKQMVLELFPEANVLYIDDHRDDNVWSGRLDGQIKSLVGPDSTVMLYGGRDSFADCYFGKWPVTDLGEMSQMSGKAIRKQIAKSSTMNLAGFRAGAIWQAYNQYPKIVQCVDGAIWSHDGSQVLMGRKEGVDKWQFIGGHVQPCDNPENMLERAVIREIREETGLEVSNPGYIGSCQVKDWSYAQEVDEKGTALFEVRYVFGKPTPMDDIEELRWISPGVRPWDIIEDHKPLMKMLLQRSLMYARGVS